MTIPELDDRDRELIAQRVTAYDRRPGARVGDYVVFADGVTRRVSYIWDDSVQTSKGGSWYFGSGRDWIDRRPSDAYVSFSGSLFTGVKPDTLTATDEHRDGRVWIFHHDWPKAHNGVDAMIPFRVFTCSEEATR